MLRYLIGSLLIIYAPLLDASAQEVDSEKFPYSEKLPFASMHQEASRRLPDKALEILRRHKTWQTSAGLYLPGYAPTFRDHRVWDLKQTPSGLILKEKTNHFVAQDCISKKYIGWQHGEIPISTELTTMDFINGGPSSCEDRKASAFFVKYVGEDKFLLLPKEGGIGILFFPAKIVNRRHQRVLQESVHLFKAPLGSGLLETISGLPIKKIDYLHHDLLQFMPVIMDRSFPDKYIETLRLSLEKWNAVLGVNFFRLQALKQDVDIYDCMSSRKLCFLWNGTEDISFLGATGNANMIFDPLTGKILGGFIGIDGESTANLSTYPSNPEIERYKKEQTSLKDIAELFAQREIAARSLHPEPLWSVGYVISHEIGHFNGLAHNFHGNSGGGLFNKTDSVMDYHTFSAIDSKSAEIGRFDVEAIDLSYRDSSPSDDYRYCRDEDTKDDGVSIHPNCNRFDFGPPHSWFIELAEILPNKVMSKHPRFDGLIIDYLGSFLKQNSKGVEKDQPKSVEAYLCMNYSRSRDVLDRLKGVSGVRLFCRAE